MNKDGETYEIDIMRLVGAVLKRWWLLLLTAIIGAVAMFGYTRYFVTPMYSAQALMYVNNNNLSVAGQSIKVSSSDLNTASRLVDTYIVILKTRLTLEEIIDRTGVSYSYEALKGMISAASVNNTEVFSVTVTSADPNEARILANAITQVLPDKVSDVIDGCSVRTVDLAVTPRGPVSPNTNRNVTIGFVIGLAFGIAVAILLEFLNDDIQSEEWLAATFGEDIPLLAVVPDGNYAGHSYYRYGKYGKYKNYYTSAGTTENPVDPSALKKG